MAVLPNQCPFHSLKVACWVALGPALLAGLLACSGADDRETLTVFAAASLTQAFTEAAAAFERQHPEYSVRLSFDGSQRLRVQMDHGAQTDVFASADPRQMRLAGESGHLAGAPMDFATNSLAVAVSGKPGVDVRSLGDLAGDNVKLVLAFPEVPAGRYAREVIDLLADDPEFGPQYSANLLKNVVSQEPNVRGVLQKVALGEADAGFVYASDLLLTDDVLALPVPPKANVAAVYSVAVLRDAANRESAEKFVRFLASAKGQGILKTHGFGPANSDTGSTSLSGPRPVSRRLQTWR